VTLSGADIQRLMEEHGLHPSRALGQNFVADPNTVRRIVRHAGVGPGSQVLEIGPGLGSLTLALAESGADVLALEVDRYLVPVLRTVVEPVGVHVVEGDALTVDLSALLEAHGPPEGSTASPWSLVANLPYNVATPLVMRVLEEVPEITSILVMVQREVAERMAASPGSGIYGSVSARIAYWAEARVVGSVPAAVFIPRPNVASALVRIARRPLPAVDPNLVSYDRLSAVIRAGFAQRRKMLRRSLAGLVEPGAFASAGVRPEARAEELGIVMWGRLAAWPATTPTEAHPSDAPPSLPPPS
jgi:16S rRNA (adenine1518-N6/adenine1519-N6)-dimethyltransferase